jgi:iron complex outermembrane receptor protein
MNFHTHCIVAHPCAAFRFRNLAAALFLFGALVQAAFAQSTLTGSVTNAATGATLEGARVVIQGTNRESITDAIGTYRFDNVPPGSVTLSVSYTGLTTQ